MILEKGREVEYLQNPKGDNREQNIHTLVVTLSVYRQSYNKTVQIKTLMFADTMNVD